MTHAIKLMVFFVISVALHGAGLWAAAGRYEPREPEAPAGVAIVDRDLFFRHAERIETRASNPVSATDRITPRSASALRPSQPGESIAPAAAAAAGETEPHRAPASPAPGTMARLDLSTVEPAPSPRRQARAPDDIDAESRELERPAPVRQASVSPSAGTLAPAEPERRAPMRPAAGSMARLDLSTVEPAPAPRREARAPDNIDSERREPERMSGVDATAPPAATRPPVRRSVPAPVPTRTPQALPATGAARQASLVIAPPLRPADDVRQAARGPAPGPVDELDTRRLHPPLQATAQLHARLAEPVTRTAADAAEHGTVESIARAPAAPAPAPDTAPTAATPTAAVMAQVPRDRPALRGTLPAPLLAARQPQVAQRADVFEPDRPPGEGVRLRATLPEALEPGRATVAAAPTQPARPATRSAAPSPASVRVPDPAPLFRAAPQELAALAPQTPARRLESSDPPAGRDDPVDRFTRAYQGGECFFPLRLASRDGASRDGASRDGAAIRGYGLRADSVEMFRQAFAQALGQEPNVDWRPLTDAQCAGISFTRLVLGDSAPTVRIALERQELGRGQTLAGRVTGSRLEFLTLLVVDDSGIVHNVLDHLIPEGADSADVAFDIPVQPVDDGTDRVQLLMAVGASQPLPILESTLPVHSDDFFPALRDQTVDTGAHLELGLEDFVILGGT